MASIIPDRMCAQIEGDFVVFLIGMRINKLWKIHKWLPVMLAMPRMLKELANKADSGFLGVESSGLTSIQYWRSLRSAGKVRARFESAALAARWTEPDGRVEIGGTYLAQWRKIDGRWMIQAELYVPTRCGGSSYCAKRP